MLKIIGLTLLIVFQTILTLIIFFLPIIEKTGGLNIREFYTNKRYMIWIVWIIVMISIGIIILNNIRDYNISNENKERGIKIHELREKIGVLETQNDSLQHQVGVSIKNILFNTELDNEVDSYFIK